MESVHRKAMAEWGIFTSIPKNLNFSVLVESTLIKWNLFTIKHYWQNGEPLKHPQNFIIFRCIWRSQYQVESVHSGWDGEYFWKKKTHGHFIFWKAWTLFLPFFFFFFWSVRPVDIMRNKISNKILLMNF